MNRELNQLLRMVQLPLFVWEEAEVSQESQEFTVLGKTVRGVVEKLDTFPLLDRVQVQLEALEFTSLCPITSQPDFGTVTIQYVPKKLGIESKSLKLYLQRFRNTGSFCEKLPKIVADRVIADIDPEHLVVIVTQQPRGGISITASYEYPEQE